MHILLLSILFTTCLSIAYLDCSGDSLSVAYNAVENGLPNTQSGYGTGGRSCPNNDISGRAWGAEIGDLVCPVSASSDLVHSFGSQINCYNSAGVKVFNHAVSGATMLNDFKKQSDSIQASMSTFPGPHQVLVFMGHNDLCNGVSTKEQSNCSNTDLDPQNYCRTSVDAFSREFRNGLDSLIIVPNTTISVLAPARVSQLCNVKNQTMCQPTLIIGRDNTCLNAWQTKVVNPSGICISLTADCSDQRVTDTYTFEKQYHDSMEAIVKEYDSLDTGEVSPVFKYNSKVVGGALKAEGVVVAFSDALWVSQLTVPDLSCCDCFHASILGQQKMADTAFSGVTCTPSTPCCSDESSTLGNANCQELITDGRYYPGVLVN